jgi:uncharacterized membrane protein HdeD (DUF308 family)
VRRRWSGLFLNLLPGILYFVMGLLMIADPAMEIAIRARALAALLIVIGVVRLFVAASTQLWHHSWLMLHAVIAVISGFLIWNSWPFSGFWMAGSLVSFNLMVEGWTEIMLAAGYP